jgi:Ca2+-binding EF-hand superfamily protein
LSKLILLEMKGLAALGEERVAIKGRYDFSRYDAFTAIDSYNIGSLMRLDLRNFLVRNKQYATALDADHLIARIDLDKDGVVTYKEFCKYVDMPAHGEDLKKMNPSQSMARLE